MLSKLPPPPPPRKSCGEGRVECQLTHRHAPLLRTHKGPEFLEDVEADLRGGLHEPVDDGLDALRGEDVVLDVVASICQRLADWPTTGRRRGGGGGQPPSLQPARASRHPARLFGGDGGRWIHRVRVCPVDPATPSGMPAAAGGGPPASGRHSRWNSRERRDAADAASPAAGAAAASAGAAASATSSASAPARRRGRCGVRGIALRARGQVVLCCSLTR